MRFTVIPREQISEYLFFHFRDERDIDSLAASVAASGIITPIPVLAPDTDALRVPVAGFSRLRAAAAAGLSEVPVRCLSRDRSAADHFFNEVSIHAAVNQISITEKARIFHILSRLNCEEPLMRRFASLLDIPYRSSVIQELAGVRDLQPSVHRYIAANRLSLKQCRIFSNMEAANQDRWMTIAAALHIKAVELVEIIQLTADSAGRLRKPVSALLDTMEIRAILESPDMNSARMRHHLKKKLRELRFPDLTEIQAKVTNLCRKAGAPACVDIRWDATLEEPGVAVEVRVKTDEDLEAAAIWLQRPGLLAVFRQLLKEI